MAHFKSVINKMSLKKMCITILLLLQLCKTCSDDAECLQCNADRCAFCYQGFPDSNGKCVKSEAVIHCFAYSSQSVCLACTEGYFPELGQCRPIIALNTCKAVGSNGNCISPIDNASPSVSASLSVASMKCSTTGCSDCIAIDKIEICTKCVDDRLMTFSSAGITCSEKKKNCLFQLTNGFCGSCASGYQLIDGECKGSRRLSILFALAFLTSFLNMFWDK